MSNERALDIRLHAPRERHEALVLGPIAGFARAVRGDPALHALFFARLNKPDWHLRLTILGRSDWVDSSVAASLIPRLESLENADGALRRELETHEREYERFGGEEGVSLAERIFFQDTLACFDWIEADSRGESTRSRRENCLVFTERILAALRLTREQRIAFHRHSYSFQLELGRWQAEEVALLERRYRSLRDELADLFSGDLDEDPERLWGGVGPAGIARAAFAALAPLLDALRVGVSEGRIRRNVVDPAWAICHLHANRMQVEANAESILAYFMHRLYEDGAIAGGGPR